MALATAPAFTAKSFETYIRGKTILNVSMRDLRTYQGYAYKGIRDSYLLISKDDEKWEIPMADIVEARAENPLYPFSCILFSIRTFCTQNNPRA